MTDFKLELLYKCTYHFKTCGQSLFTLLRLKKKTKKKNNTHRTEKRPRLSFSKKVKTFYFYNLSFKSISSHFFFCRISLLSLLFSTLSLSFFLSFFLFLFLFLYLYLCLPLTHSLVGFPLPLYILQKKKKKKKRSLSPLLSQRTCSFYQ